MAKEKKFTSTTLAPDDEISQLYRILTRANEIASNTELDDLLDQMLDLIIEVCGGNAGTLYLLDSEHGELEFKVIRGPNSDQSLIGKMMQAFYKGLLFIFPGPETVLSYTHVDDIAEGHILAAEKGKPGESYIITGPALSFRQIVPLWAQACGRPKLYTATKIPPVRNSPFAR